MTVHEFGHQYWQSMVASNEFEESWLDEGFNTHSTAKVMQRVYGPWTVQLLGLRIGEGDLSRAGNSVDRMFDAIRTPSWGYSPGNYGFNSYQRTDLTLQTLESLLGTEAMARAMRTYHERWRFRHPTSEDFYAVVAEVAGRDARWFFDQTVERPGILDDEVASVRSQRVPEPRGVFGEGEAKTTVTTKEAREKEREADKAGGRPWRSTIVVRRRGEVTLPMSLSLEFEGGTSQAMSLQEQDFEGAKAETMPLLDGRRRGPALARPLEADRAHGRAPAGLGHRRPREPRGDRRQPAQQLPTRRAGRPGGRALGRAVGVLAAAGARHGGALGS